MVETIELIEKKVQNPPKPNLANLVVNGRSLSFNRRGWKKKQKCSFYERLTIF